VVQEAVAADECLESVKREVFGNGEEELGGNRNEGWWRRHDGWM
jgi:hypothetical protein